MNTRDEISSHGLMGPNKGIDDQVGSWRIGSLMRHAILGRCRLTVHVMFWFTLATVDELVVELVEDEL